LYGPPALLNTGFPVGLASRVMNLKMVFDYPETFTELSGVMPIGRNEGRRCFRSSVRALRVAYDRTKTFEISEQFIF
jgi:hypothetical protein